jgi:hypothetical protein
MAEVDPKGHPGTLTRIKTPGAKPIAKLRDLSIQILDHARMTIADLAR